MGPTSIKPLALMQNGAALRQKRLSVVQKTLGDLCSLGPKDLVHPLLTTLGDFLFTVTFPGPWLPNPSSLSNQPARQLIRTLLGTFYEALSRTF